MRVHVLQHVPFEGLGSIHHWLTNAQAKVTWTRFFESPDLPGEDEFDVLIALGGPMSVNDEASLPWLKDEKQLVRAAIQSGKGVLGICLGAQLMASALGARVYPGAHKEIGWFPVTGKPTNSLSFEFPATTDVFHWHGETFDLPDNATHLAFSEGCRHQAFQIGSRALGLQFHLETTAESGDAIISHCRQELLPGRYVQSETKLRSVVRERYDQINHLMSEVLAYVTRSEA
jgi:GMP synthase-like glutamine amidotransferase